MSEIAPEVLERGYQYWDWNAVTGDGAEDVTAEDEVKSAKSLSDSLASTKEKSIVHEKLCEICDRSNSLIENEISADNAEILQKSLVKVLKGAKK